MKFIGSSVYYYQTDDSRIGVEDEVIHNRCLGAETIIGGYKHGLLLWYCQKHKAYILDATIRYQYPRHPDGELIYEVILHFRLSTGESTLAKITGSIMFLVEMEQVWEKKNKNYCKSLLASVSVKAS